MIPEDHKKAIDDEIKYFANNNDSGVVENNTITDIEGHLNNMASEYLEYLQYKKDINHQVKENIIKLGKYEAKRRKWKNDEDILEVGDSVLRLVEADNYQKTRKQALNEHKDYNVYVILNIDNHKAHIKN